MSGGGQLNAEGLCPLVPKSMYIQKRNDACVTLLKDYRGFTGAEKLAIVRLHCYSMHA